jgi:hypothetical protein
MIPVGVTALVLGDGASRAFTLLPGGSMIAHLLGVLLSLGGALVTGAILANEYLIEAIGLALMSGGAAMYGMGVVLGLGLNGVIAGGGFLAIAVGSTGRVFILVKLANAVRPKT